MASQRPPKRRYVTRVFGLYAGGTYRGQYVQRIPLYYDHAEERRIIGVGLGTVTVSGEAPEVTNSVQVGVGAVTVTGYAPTHVQVRIQVIGEAVLYIPENTKPTVILVNTPTPGVGDVTITGYAPTIKQELHIAVGVGTITVSGYPPEKYATQSSELALIAQYRIKRLSIGSGVHRRSQYQIVRTLIPTTSEGSEQAGVATLTIQGNAPVVSAVIGSLVLPGAGEITLTGLPLAEAVLQDLTNTGIWKTFVRRTMVGSGVYRRPHYTVHRQFLYFKTYGDTGITVSVGAGTVTISGEMITLEPNFRYTQTGTITIQGLPPSPILDGKVSTLEDEEVELLKMAARRRRLAARFENSYPKFRPYNNTVIDFVRARPQRIIGVPNGRLILRGYRPTLRKVVPAGVGTITIQGQQLTYQSKITTGVGAVTVTGYQVVVDGLITVQKQPGVASLIINGKAISILADGIAYAGSGVGTITINGGQVALTAQSSFPVGVGAITVTGYAVTASVVTRPGVAAVTIAGSTPTVLISRAVSNPGPGQIYIRNQRIGISLPEKQSNPGVGTVVYSGSSPKVVTTGAWEKTAGSEISWTQENASTGTWAKNSRSTKSWKKL